MTAKQDDTRGTQAIRSIDGFLWTIYAFSGAGTGFALASFGSPWWASVLGGLAWPAEVLYLAIQILQRSAGS